jgi:hypothetical protein
MSIQTTDQPIIRLQNTKTRRREEFLPLDPNRIGIYLCGPTVYDRAHLGNARPVLMFDVLYRLLRQAYGVEHVVYVRNFTDVDDKINARAAEAGREIGDITAETIRWYHEDMDALGALRPDHEPRATDFIGAMVDMIRELIEPGSKSRHTSAIRWISYCGSRLAQVNPDGTALGASAAPVGISNALPCPAHCWAPSLTFMAAATICCSRTTRTR